ncbi:MAG: hypothetical protein ACI9Y1_002327 [Lentisphaeria bacterium]|jgi:hypothetical protein
MLPSSLNSPHPIPPIQPTNTQPTHPPNLNLDRHPLFQRIHMTNHPSQFPMIICECNLAGAGQQRILAPLNCCR